MPIDPICGMEVEPETAAGSHDHAGTTYYFCHETCLTKFKAAPEKYLRAGTLPSIGALPPTSVKPPAGTIYTCPMDPEVKRHGPAACPKCGMALEPMEPPAPLTRTEYVCPMHPEIVRNEPGDCPICGMALEARTIALEEANPELVDMSRRFWIGLASLSILIVVLQVA